MTRKQIVMGVGIRAAKLLLAPNLLLGPGNVRVEEIAAQSCVSARSGPDTE